MNALKIWRKKNNLSQEKVAELFSKKAKELGYKDKWSGHYVVSRKESGQISIDPTEAKILETITGLPREWFLYPDEYTEEIQAYMENKQLEGVR